MDTAATSSSDTGCGYPGVPLETQKVLLDHLIPPRLDGHDRRDVPEDQYEPPCTTIEPGAGCR